MPYYESLFVRPSPTPGRKRRVLWGLLFLAVCVACVGLMLLFMEKTTLSWIEMTGLVPLKSMDGEKIATDKRTLNAAEREALRRQNDFDPRDRNHIWHDRILRTVDDQGSCGSCVSFATAHMLADRYNVASSSSSNPPVIVSPQSLLDAYSAPRCQSYCDVRCNTENSKCACGTGVPTIESACKTVGVLIEDGDCRRPYDARWIYDESRKPWYLNNQSANPAGCSPNGVRLRITPKGLVRTSDETVAETELRTRGTLCAIIEVPPWFHNRLRSAEVLHPPEPGTHPDYPNDVAHGLHMVCVVGVTRDAWIVRNSWGSRVHDRGFFRLKKNVNALRIADWGFYYPIDDVVRA